MRSTVRTPAKYEASLDAWFIKIISWAIMDSIIYDIYLM